MVTGVLLGACLSLGYHWGLWWTVQRLAGAARGVALALTSFAARTAALAGLIVGITRGVPSTIAAVVIGFVATRSVLIWIVARRTSDTRSWT